MADNQDYNAILLEEVREQFRVLAEGISDIKQQTVYIPEMKQDIKRLRDDVETIKQAVTDTNHDLADLQGRVARLEAA